MTQRNEPPKYSSRRNAYSHSRSTSNRVNVPHARDELERERELYSAHDPRQSAASPAQRYAEAQKKKEQAAADRQCYWSQHPNDTGRSAGSLGRRTISARDLDASTQASAKPTGNGRANYTTHPAQSARMDRVSSTTPHDWSNHTAGTPSASGRIPRTVAPSASGRIPRTADPSTSGYFSHTNPSTTSRTPRVGEATLSGHFERVEADPNKSGSLPKTENGETQTSRTPHAYGTSSRRNARKNTPTRRSANANQTNGVNKNQENADGGSGNTPGGSESVRSFDAGCYLSTKRPTSGGSIRNKLIAAVAAVAVVAVGVFAFTTWDANKSVNVTINGEQKTIEGPQRSLEGLLDTNTVSVTPGNYVAVDGSVMREGEGTRAVASVNGEEKSDLSVHLNEGDEVSISNGTDITEQYTESEPQSIPPSFEVKGSGAVHLYTQKSEPGEKVTRTGNESGKTAEVTTKEPVDGVMQYYNVNTNGDKVIALTFDDGPWDDSTAAILDTLKEYDAKATFFTVGQKISGREDLVKRAIEEGHEVGTHTWDHAAGSGQGVSLILMSSDERKQEVEKGLQAIKDASGQDASTIFRAPGGNFDASVASDLSSIITAEIGWNIDTGDWKKPGADVIAERIKSAEPGEIILMHDGGGDRSETVAALKQALPVLKEEGYRFVTVEELINTYPYQEGQ